MEYSHYLSSPESPFNLEAWRGKTLLDIGSGGEARFATDAAKQGVKVISLNPALALLENRLALDVAIEEVNNRWQQERQQTKQVYEERYGRILGSLVCKFFQRDLPDVITAPSFAGLAQDMPFENEIFDGVVSVYAVPYYLHDIRGEYTEQTRSNDKVLIRSAFSEILRVMKPGGSALLYDRHLRPDGNYEETVKRRVYSQSDGTEVEELLAELNEQGIDTQTHHSLSTLGLVGRLITIHKPL
jgi:SAM-dependent methyltransferase